MVPLPRASWKGGGGVERGVGRGLLWGAGDGGVGVLLDNAIAAGVGWGWVDNYCRVPGSNVTLRSRFCQSLWLNI